MNKKDLKNIYKSLEQKEQKILFIEQLILCEYADDYDFNNLFRIEELSESELYALLDFMYHEDCFLTMQRVLNKYKDKLVTLDTSFLDYSDNLRTDFDARYERLSNNFEEICHF